MDSNKFSCGIHFFKVLVQIHYSFIVRVYFIKLCDLDVIKALLLVVNRGVLRSILGASCVQLNSFAGPLGVYLCICDAIV
jgi:hypothetical protein